MWVYGSRRYNIVDAVVAQCVIVAEADNIAGGYLHNTGFVVVVVGFDLKACVAEDEPVAVVGELVDSLHCTMACVVAGIGCYLLTVSGSIVC